MDRRRARLLILLLAVACKYEETVGGPWRIVSRSRLPEAGSNQPRLYHRDDSGDQILVDELVHKYRAYENGQCICYRPTRDYEFYAACAGRQPVRLSTDKILGTSMDALKLRSCGLVTTEPTNNVKDQNKRFVFRAETIFRIARQQPPLREGWWARRDSIQTIQPELVDVQNVCEQ